MTDIPLSDAMLCWNSGLRGGQPGFAVIHHPDRRGLSDEYDSSVGACFADWRKMSDRDQRLKLMIEAWHIAAFYEVPIKMVSDGLMVIPEYRDMLAYDCLPKQFRHERDG